jgi:hypothetical protein
MIHPPSALAILLPGVYLSATAWGWGQAWINASLALTVLLAALAPAINGRKLSAIGRALNSAPDGPLPAGPRALIHDPVLHGSEQVMAALGLGIIFLMTVKPGPSGTAMTIAVALVLGCATSLSSWRTVGAATPGEVARTATE